MAVIQVKQAATGATRLLAVSAADARMVREHAASIDTVTVLGCVDVYRDGRAEWGATGPRYRDIPADIRAELSAEAQL